LYACVVATVLLASGTALALEGPDVRLDDRRPSSRSLGFPTDLTARSMPVGEAHPKALGSWNMTQVGALDIHVGYNDIWGYTDEFGTEYAILGLVNGTSIVNVSNPAAPVETGFIPAIRPSTWRDMKTYGDYCWIRKTRCSQRHTLASNPPTTSS
jgi:hypothetical protein